MSNDPVVLIKVGLDDGSTVTPKGRAAWALNELISAGERGVTPIMAPAPRWSHYVFLLRRAGLNVQTIDEPHGGAFSGTHARYVLRTPLTVVSITRQSETRRAA